METLEDRRVLAAAFFAPPDPSGTVNVQLVPLANVAAGVPEIVTFGVPFTRGSVTQTQLSQVRVMKNGAEVPAFVEQLTPWRSIDDTAIDGQSVRVARIQIPYTFSTLNPESITVQWGGPPRTLNRTTLQDPRIEWHTVTSGTFVAADNVEEPDVLPVLPAAYMAKGMFDAQTEPMVAGVTETRDDPAVMDAMSFSGFTEFDYAEKNFFYTIINQNSGITVPYKTDPEPWLYDRSAGMYELYFRSGFATALREAVRSADFYVDHLDSSGFFTLKPGDPKYAYNESLAYTYWLLGDSHMVAPISTVVNAYSGTQTHWTPSLSFFTERNTGDKLLANEMAYEVTGNAAFKSGVQTIVGDLVYLQNGANGQLPANRIDGGLYHTGAQHDITEASSGDVLIASSWMSALVVDPMVRVFGVWQDNPQVPDFIVRLGNFEKAASKTDADGQFGGTTRYPDYLMRTDGTSDSRSDTDVQHAMDVGAVAAWATYFAELRGTPDPSLRQLANDLYATYDVGVNFWTRPGGTNFNVSPPRRYTWEYKNSPSFSWALTATDTPAQPGTLQFSAGSYHANENQGTTTITVSRTGGSTGSVTVNYATADGTATASSDYTAASGTLTFGNGETSKTFTIPIIDDTAVENPETVTLTLSNPTGGAALASPSTATLTIDSDDTTNQPITVSFQQGVNGYTSTTDADISTQYVQFTGGNGSTGTTGDQLGVYQLPGTDGYTIEGLIRFADLGITSNATVASATLTLNVDTWDANTVIRGYYLAAPWTTAPGTDLGWLHRGTGRDWATPGALGQGTDVVAGKSFVIPGITPSGPQTRTINLDPAIVQSWIANPASDQGILLVNETTGAVVRVNTSENATIASRPKLNVTYTVGSPTQQPGTLQFSNASYSVNENGGTATITVTRNSGSDGAVSVDYATSNGTATAGSDYTAASGTLNFAAGELTKTFAVPILNDTAVENFETVNLILSNPTGGAILGNVAAATLTINDDDVAHAGALQFSAANYSVNETQGTAMITVTRTGGSDGAVSVNYATSDGTATAGSDYTASSGTLNFGAGETSKTLTIPITNDTLVEGDETVNLALASPSGGASLGSQATATLTINSDDTTSQSITKTFQQGVSGYTGTADVNISTQYAQFTGGNGTTSLNAPEMGVYQTTGSGSYTMESLIRFSNLGIPAGATVSGATLTLGVYNWDTNPTIRGSYVLAPWNGAPGTNLGWLHRGTGQDWAAPGAIGQGTDLVAGKSFSLGTIRAVGQQMITVTLDPAVVQSWIDNPSADQGILLVNQTPGKIVRVNASENSSISLRPKLSITYSTGTTTPQPGTLQFSNAAYSVGENGGTATITVTRNGGSDGAVSVNYATSNGTATAGSDYTAASGTLNFATGELSKTFTIPITNDTLFEGNETINLALSSPTGGATLGSQSASVLTIQDDDSAPQPGTLQLNASSYSLMENGGTLTVTVTRTGGTSGAVFVHYATSDGTATAGSDYSAASGTLNFANGEASKTFTITVLDDSVSESNETINIALSNATGGATLGTPASAVFTIIDDDSPSGVTLPTGFTQTTIATGLNSLTAMTAAADGRLFVLEQGGNVRVVKNGAVLPTPAFTVTTIAEQERGLIGITLDPNFATNHFVYVMYTVGGPSPNPAHNRISRFTLNGDVAVPGSELPLLDLPNTTNRIHDGGGMKFGADGKLYIAVGNDNQFFIAQDLTNPFGKILRINSDGTIPTDNPFFNQPGAYKAIWAYGLRNPFTLDVQPGTGLMYINDVGEASFEEIDQGVAGGNFGWPDSEGYTTNPQFQSPVYAYAHGTGPNQGFAIVGGAFYNSQAATFPSQYVGKYFFADFVNGWISYVDPAAPNPKIPTTFATGLPIRFDGGPVDLDVGADGALYYLDRFGGGVFKIQFTSTAQPPGITQQPNSQSVPLGQSAMFTVGASSSMPLTYQWQKMDSGTTTFVNVSGATSPSLTINSTTAADNGDQFRCLVSNSAGSTTSSAATLTVTSVTPPPTGTFTKITTQSGVEAGVNANPPGWLSGMHLVDLDGDGDLDLFVSAHGTDDAIALLNNGSGVFTRATGNFPKSEIHLPADLNEDGKIDLTTTFADGGSQWWLNNSTPGNLNFTATNITRDTNTGRDQTLLDINKDGKADWIRGTEQGGIKIDLGNGTGGFTQDAAAINISGIGNTADPQARFVDIDGDGDDDLVTEWGQYSNLGGFSRIFRNDGNMHFTDITASAGLPTTEGFSVKGVGDVDQDGDTDLIVTENLGATPQFYLNDGAGHFTQKVGAISGAPGGTLTYASWGLGVVTDFDNDGIADIVIAGKFYLEVLRGTSGGNFTYMDNAWGIRDTAAMSVDDGYAFGDIDQDGDLDLIGYRDTFPDRTLEVYRNDLATKNWINVRPIGLAGNIGAGGAKIRIFDHTTQQLVWYEDVQNYDSQVAQSYYAYGQTERHFGLGNRTNVDVEVTFYSTGRVTRMSNVAANQTIQVLESAGSVPQMSAAASQSAAVLSLSTTAQLSSGHLQPTSPARPAQPAVVTVSGNQFTKVPSHIHHQSMKAPEATVRRSSIGRQQHVTSADLHCHIVDELFAGDIKPLTTARDLDV